MARLNLTANTDNQKLVLAYLEENASDSLVERINTKWKSLDDCWRYIVSRARRLAKNNCACISDTEVFGWAVHFFEEEGNMAGEKIEKPVNTGSSAKVIPFDPVKPAAPKVEEKKPEQKKTKKSYDIDGQIDMFSLLGGE